MIVVPEYISSLLKDRGYFHDGENTWEDLSRRVAKALASAELTEDAKKSWEDKFFDLLSNQRFVNSTPTLMNADLKSMGGLSSCFIIDIKDDLSEIYKAVGKCAKIYQYNGGVGFDISPLRPAMAPLHTAHGFAGGPVAFMESFNVAAANATLYNHRKSATKIDLQVWHPDIQNFIHCKDDGESLKLMNISVSIPDVFMRAVENDEDWVLMFPDYEATRAIYDKEWDGDIYKWIDNGLPIKIYKTMKARELFREICESAWKRGDPGIVFFDHMREKNPNKHVSKIIESNPCSEFNSMPYTSCCLGSFNLMAYVNNGYFDFTGLLVDVRTAVRMLDNVITLNKFPLPEIKDMTQKNRSIGIGIMGYADLLYTLDIPYDSKKSEEFLDDLISKITFHALQASKDLADKKGAYPNYKGSYWDKNDTFVRNSDFTSIAPTGTISTICGVSSSIEPNFGLVYERHTADGRTFYITNKIFENKLKELGIYSEDLLKRISMNHGSCQGIPEIPSDIQKIFVTAYDVSPKSHIDVCASAQKGLSLSVSKTVNLPNNATVEDIEKTYKYAFDKGLLGITVYRDGCRDNQVLTTGSTYKQEEPEDEKDDENKWGYVLEVKDDVFGLKRKLRTGCGTVHFQCYFDMKTGRMVETFADRGGLGGCTALLSSLGRSVSRSLRLGDTPAAINEQLQKTLSCGSYSLRRGSGKVTSKGFSCASAIGWAMMDMDAQAKQIFKVLKGESDDGEVSITIIPSKDRTCPKCGADVANDGGCVTCVACGWSKCG